MLIFSVVEADYLDKVFLPEKNLCFSLCDSDQLDKSFLCVVSCERKSIFSNPVPRSRYEFDRFLYYYMALPYKRQSSVDSLDKSVFRDNIRSCGIPWSYNYAGLSEMKNFYLSCKRYYVVVACHKGGNEEKVVFLFERYSDAISLIRDFSYRKIRSLLGSDFEAYNSWYPYLWVEYMGHPICLFSDIDSHAGNYSLGPTWCYYLVCFLKYGYFPDENEYFDFVFGLAYRDKFSQIIHWDASLVSDSES
jgi:hypothetical protein